MKYTLKAFLYICMFGGTVFAQPVAGVDLPHQAEIDGKPLVLNGAGLREAMFIHVDVYVAGLYLETKTADPERILHSQELKRLVIQFVRDVDVSEIHEDLDEGFENHGHTNAAMLEKLKKLKQQLVSIKKGERLVFTFYPDKVSVLLPGNKSVSVEGGDFAEALLEIWLGKEAAQEKLKTALLGATG